MSLEIQAALKFRLQVASYIKAKHCTLVQMTAGIMERLNIYIHVHQDRCSTKPYFLYMKSLACPVVLSR
jgi:hypothetical protein